VSKKGSNSLENWDRRTERSKASAKKKSPNARRRGQRKYAQQWNEMPRKKNAGSGGGGGEWEDESRLEEKRTYHQTERRPTHGQKKDRTSKKRKKPKPKRNRGEKKRDSKSLRSPPYDALRRRGSTPGITNTGVNLRTNSQWEKKRQGRAMIVRDERQGHLLFFFVVL